MTANRTWQGATAIVTGGASGLGGGVATRLADEGMAVVIFDLDQAKGKAHAEAIGGRFIAVDVADSASVAAGIKAAGEVPRVLVNCAGIGGAAKTVSRGEAHDPALFRRTIDINLIGTFNCAAQCAAAMAASDPVDADGARGVIVNTASVAAYEGQIGQLAYAASKGGIAAMTLPMARDLADKGIRVCAIAPGIFKTPLLDTLSDEAQQSLGAQTPFPKRLGDVAEFAALAYHIIDNPMLNGEVIRLDGAIRMGPR